MARHSYDDIKQRKNFYRDAFRRTVIVLLFSVVVSFILIAAILYTVWNKPEQTYYATNGETSPIQLQALEQANQSSEALLPDDPPDDMSKSSIFN